jgi:hypothetical protein
MTDARELTALSPDERAVELARRCEAGLPLIRAYFADPKRRRYVDSVVGIVHDVDVELPARVLDAIRAAGGIPEAGVLDALFRDYMEPMTAHQDDDLSFSDDPTEFAYLAIYNLLVYCRKPEDVARAELVLDQVGGFETA